MGQDFVRLLKMIFLYSQILQGQSWLRRYQGKQARFACILGFTATGLIPGISAAGATPQDREYTAIADAEFLVQGVQATPQHSLPHLTTGASPVFITRAIAESCQLPTDIFNAGLLHPPTVEAIDLQGMAANCVSSGRAMNKEIVKHLFQQGMKWGAKLAVTTDYLIIGECVVGGTTTALAVLSGLGVNASGMVNSSHPCCNHEQKWLIVQQGLQKSGLNNLSSVDPFDVVAAVGDPMQIVAAGMAITASRHGGVLLAGGTQMLAVYALIKQIINYTPLAAEIEQIVVGTTRWVAEDSTGDTIKLAQKIGGVSLLATGLNFATSKYPSFRAYEAGYVKEGVGAGGCAIYAHLAKGKTSIQVLNIIENLFAQYP
ncbi:conserved hypothetical protein [Hyella patelloides LEGE 07179]|uniref:UPF0284 protein H1P_1900003 n=2 Tax=Hyella TaxID=945733 RepID=A0A563VP64_9CYAN|nr:conserved hypothetical protein [Hyella patelloides LEGE 07179]